MPSNPTDFRKALSDMVHDVVTKDDFVKAFQHILKWANDTKRKNETEFLLIHQSLNVLADKLKEDTASDTASMRQDVKDAVAAQIKAIDAKLTAVDAKLATVIDGEPGKDADEAKIVADVIAQIKLPDLKEVILDTPEQLAAKLDSIEYLKKFDDLENKLNDGIKRMGQQVPARSSNSTKFYDLSSQTTGSLKVFAVPEGLAGVLFSSDFPAVLMEGNGFTLNRTRTQLTMTTTNAPSAGSQLLYQYISQFNQYN